MLSSARSARNIEESSNSKVANKDNFIKIEEKDGENFENFEEFDYLALKTEER